LDGFAPRIRGLRSLQDELGKTKERVTVLPVDTFGGAGVTVGGTFEMGFSLNI
jgi:hypothetical protein